MRKMKKGKDRSERSGLFFIYLYGIADLGLPERISMRPMWFVCRRSNFIPRIFRAFRLMRDVFPLMKYRTTVQICRFLHS